MLTQVTSRQQGVLKVKMMRSIATIVAFVVVATVANLPSAVAQTRVAIVDIGQVFKSHSQFSAQLKALQQHAEQFKTTSLQAQQALVSKAEVLKQYQPGSQEFKSAESKLAQESAAMEVDQRDTMRKLMQQEAKLHFATYEQVNATIAEFCEPRGIQLVLRFNNKEMDPKNPATVMQRVNGSVIFHNQQNDITSEIVAQIAKANGTANAGSAPTRR